MMNLLEKLWIRFQVKLFCHSYSDRVALIWDRCPPILGLGAKMFNLFTLQSFERGKQLYPPPSQMPNGTMLSVWMEILSIQASNVVYFMGNIFSLAQLTSMRKQQTSFLLLIKHFV